MKRELDLIEEFFSDTKRGDKYRKCVSDLEKMGLREVLIKLANLPTELSDNVSIESSAVKYAHLSGWFACLNAVFTLYDFLHEKQKQRSGSDIYTEAVIKNLKDMGYETDGANTKQQPRQ